MAIIRNNADRLLVITHQGPDYGPPILCIKRDAVTDGKLQHGGVRPHLVKKPQALHDAPVKVDEFGFGQLINLDGHERYTGITAPLPTGYLSRREVPGQQHLNLVHRGGLRQSNEDLGQVDPRVPAIGLGGLHQRVQIREGTRPGRAVR